MSIYTSLFVSTCLGFADKKICSTSCLGFDKWLHYALSRAINVPDKWPFPNPP